MAARKRTTSPKNLTERVDEEAPKYHVSESKHLKFTGKDYSLQVDASEKLSKLPSFPTDKPRKSKPRTDTYVDFAEAVRLAFGVKYEASWQYFNLLQDKFKDNSPSKLTKKMTIHECEGTRNKPRILFELPYNKRTLTTLIEVLDTFGLYDSQEKELKGITYVSRINR